MDNNDDIQYLAILITNLYFIFDVTITIPSASNHILL